MSRRPAGERSDAGLSLVELLAAAFISLLILSLVGAMFAQVSRLTARAQATKDATAVGWTVLNELSNVTRQAAQVDTSATVTEGGVIAGSTATTLIVDAYVDAAIAPSQSSIAPTQVTFTVDASGYLVESRLTGTLSNGYYGFTGAATSRKVNGPGVLTTGVGSNPLFAYYAGATQVVPAAGGLTADQASSITAVGLNVTVATAAATGTDPVQLINTITMPNIAIANGGS